MKKLTLTGRIASNAEIRVLPSGSKLLEFRLANNERSFNANGGNKVETYWFRVVSFNENHFKLQPFLTKGKPIEVIGDLYANPYVSKTTNTLEPGLEVTANALEFDYNFGKSEDKDSNSTPVQSSPSPTPQNVQANTTAQVPRNPVTTTVKPVTVQPTVSNDDNDDLPF